MTPQIKQSDQAIESKIQSCPQLASLKQLKSALSSLVNADQSYTSQIADIIRRDPSLTTRLLRLVNSAFFGLSQKVTDIEDAVFYLGLKQIRELALATPIIDDIESLKASKTNTDWSRLWKHSLGVAIMTRDLMALAKMPTTGEEDYIAGLVHNIGKVVMASVFPAEFKELFKQHADTPEEFAQLERQTLGWDHARIGACYLKKYQLPETVITATAFHHAPHAAPQAKELCAAIQIADIMVRFIGLTSIEKTSPVQEDAWLQVPSWKLLFGEEAQLQDHDLLTLKQKLIHLPATVNKMV